MRDFQVVRLLVRSSVRVVRSFGSFIRSVVRSRHRCVLVVVKPFGWYTYILPIRRVPRFSVRHIFPCAGFFGLSGLSGLSFTVKFIL